MAYDPNQPRVPAGNPNGGEWTSSRTSALRTYRQNASYGEILRANVTDSRSLAQELNPNDKIRSLNDKSIIELKRLAVKKSADDTPDYPQSKPVLLGKVNFADEKLVLSTLGSYEKDLVDLPYEVNITITTDGSVWRVDGTDASVDPSSIPHSLEGSYSYHNHPKEATWCSFSADDVAFFLTTKEQCSIASDDKFVYKMTRTSDTKNDMGDRARYEFERAHKNALEKSLRGLIDIDIDGYHEVLISLSKTFCFEYERRKK